jgi:hypothetical protein
MSQHKLVTFEVRIPPDRIVAEAKRWGIEDDVGLRVSPGGAVTLAVSTSRGRQFVEHLTSVDATASASSNSHVAEAIGPHDCPALHEIPSAEWLDVARWAEEIDQTVASGRRLPGAVALKLARAIIALNREAETTGIVVRPTDTLP